MRAFLEANELTDRQVWLAGRFRSSPAGDAPARPLEDGGVEDLLADLNQVREAFAALRPPRRARAVPAGRVRRDAPGLADRAGRAHPDRRTTRRRDRGRARAAVRPPQSRRVRDRRVRHGSRRSRRARSLPSTPRDHEPDGARRLVGPGLAQGSRLGEHHDRADRERGPRSRRRSHRRRRPNALDLSVVVVFYNMRREAARTLHSLSRAYQQGIERAAVRGDRRRERLGRRRSGSARSSSRSFGPEFRYLDLGDAATPSPTDALNRGIRHRARAGVRAHDRRRPRRHPGRPEVRHGRPADLRSGGRRHPAVVRRARAAAGRRRPGLRPDHGGRAVRGDRVAHRRVPALRDQPLHRRARLVRRRAREQLPVRPRSLLEQVGGFDDSFSVPGGGYANLDLWERLGLVARGHAW